MRTFELTTSVWVPAPTEGVFQFFSRADNLERLTPAFLNFRILTAGPRQSALGGRHSDSG